MQRLELEWTAVSWSPQHDQALERLLIELSTGEKYCHTRNLETWLSQQEGLEGISASTVKAKVAAKLAAIHAPVR